MTREALRIDSATIDAVKLAEKLAQFDDCWRPRVVGEFNSQVLKVAKTDLIKEILRRAGCD